MLYSVAQTRKKLQGLLMQPGIRSCKRRDLDEEQLSSFEVLPCLHHGKITKRVVLALPTKGCALFRRQQGGCLHCGLFTDGIIRDYLDSDELITQFAEKLNRLDISDCPVLCIYTPGSFLDNQELDPDTRNNILLLAARKKGIRKIIFESLPRHITRKNIQDLKILLPRLEIEIAVGLDTRNDLIRSVCINKNFSLKTFEQARGILRQNEMSWSAFALLKPPFLTEQEAIIDTVQTARYLHQSGAAAVSIEPMAIHEHTFTWRLFRKNLYRPPWLWSIIEVIKQLPPGFEIRIGGLVVYPKTIQSTYNCSLCTREIWQKIQEFNLLQDRNIFNHLDCACKNQWTEEIRTVYPPLLDRINTILQDFDETSPG